MRVDKLGGLTFLSVRQVNNLHNVETEPDDEVELALSTTEVTCTLSEEVGVEREALAFVAGFVAHKVKAYCPHLGEPTRSAVPSRVPDRWLRLLSRGGLLVPSQAWMEVVERFELTFCQTMGPEADHHPGIVARLLAALLQKEPTLDPRVARKLAVTRLHIRLRWLNLRLSERRAERRAAKQIRQHQCGL